MSTSSFETSPAVTLDGLTLYRGSDRSGGVGEVDIWQVTRADRTMPWGNVTDVAALNSPTKDVPPPLGQHDLVMRRSRCVHGHLAHDGRAVLAAGGAG